MPTAGMVMSRRGACKGPGNNRNARSTADGLSCKLSTDAAVAAEAGGDRCLHLRERLK